MAVGMTWAALPRPLVQALESGGTVVTPNNRLARRLVALNDDAQRRAGRGAWALPVVVPWSGWLERLWLDALAEGGRGSEQRVLAAAPTRHLWRRIVAASDLSLIDGAGAAALAADAWTIAHAWGAGGASWRAWEGRDDDSAVFARWANDYERRLGAAGVVDVAQLPDRLASDAGGVRTWQSAAVTLAGFVELSPQQERLLAALRRAGMSIGQCASIGDVAGSISRYVGASPGDEVKRALLWARERALADPAATIAIAIEDFAARREEVRSLAEEILCPALQWPGNDAVPRPYDLSLGVAADKVPIIASALDLIDLARGRLAMGAAAALLRSPYIAGDWLGRAALEADWLREGRRELAADDVIASLAGADPTLAMRWRRAREERPCPADASPREWTDHWRAWLGALGWPGARSLSSPEWQARAAFDELLAQFAAFGPVARRLSARDAVLAIRALAADHVFQPESTGAPIAIMGVLEAAGLPVDALWVAGLAADVWPPVPRPNPLLAVEWQRERGVPRSTAARELAYAEALTAQWARGASDVVFSHAKSAEDPDRVVSALIPAATQGVIAPSAQAATALVQYQGRGKRESAIDDCAPPLAPGVEVHGGAALIEAQSGCPFQAWARFRLNLDPWPEPLTGLSQIERGNLVHAALAGFWRRVRDQAQFAVMTPGELTERVAAAAADALRAVPPTRWRNIPPAVRGSEPGRLATIVRAWLDGVERARPPFAVAEIEAKRRLVLNGVTLALRLDRVDMLDRGGVAIIDYKTGRVKSPTGWFDVRPEAPQIGLYVLAQRQFAPTQPIAAAAFAQLRPGDVLFHGIAADTAEWPGLLTAQDVLGGEGVGWPAIEARWAGLLGGLAGEVRDGIAAVAPRDVRKTCARCGRQSLCRIGFRSDAEPGDDDG